MPRTLYKVDPSPPARAVMMVLDLLNVPDVKLQDVDLFGFAHRKEDFAKMNPQCTVPTYVEDDFAIWDSHAIAAYLVGTYAKDDSLYPKDLKKRALVDQRLHFDSGVLFPGLIQSAKGVIWQNAKALNPDGLERVQQGYEILERFLTGRTWLTGDTMTIGDICCVATVSSNNEYNPVDAEKYPNTIRWLYQFYKLDFYQKANASGCKAFGDIIRSKLA